VREVRCSHARARECGMAQRQLIFFKNLNFFVRGTASAVLLTGMATYYNDIYGERMTRAR
jgi:hypothetical protein